MVCGIDIYNGAGKKSILGFTSTFNRTFTKYISIAKICDDSSHSKLIAECMDEAVKNVILSIFIISLETLTILLLSIYLY
jgi:hypothetical protein